MAFKKYKLTETQLKKIARLCVQEQGSVAGVKAEASLMANQLETSKSRQNKYGMDGGALYHWVRDSGWFYRAAYFMDNTTVGKKYIDAVREVLVDGKRTLPQYVDEHDCLSDISSISTGSVKDKSAYISGKTIIKNKMGSTYTFYSFPAVGSDPFGYTKAAYEYVKSIGSGVQDSFDDAPERVSFNASLPIISRGSKGFAVEIWQTIVGSNPDGDFGPATQAATLKWQESNGVVSDGIVGKASWKKALNSL